MYGLFDADADGLDIMRCYSVGSKALAQEVEFCVPELKWLVIDLKGLNPDDLIPLTTRDRGKALSMLTKSEQYKSCQFVDMYCETLQQILMLNCKAEIQSLENNSRQLIVWLELKIMKDRTPTS